MLLRSPEHKIYLKGGGYPQERANNRTMLMSQGLSRSERLPRGPRLNQMNVTAEVSTRGHRTEETITKPKFAFLKDLFLIWPWEVGQFPHLPNSLSNLKSLMLGLKHKKWEISHRENDIKAIVKSDESRSQ